MGIKVQCCYDYDIMISSREMELNQHRSILTPILGLNQLIYLGNLKDPQLTRMFSLYTWHSFKVNILHEYLILLFYLVSYVGMLHISLIALGFMILDQVSCQLRHHTCL